MLKIFKHFPLFFKYKNLLLSFNNYYNKIFFYNYKYFLFLEKRIEAHNDLYKNKIKKIFVLNYIFYFLLKIEYNNIKKKFITKYFYDLIFSYRGWRYFKKLPVNGQRTRAGFNNFLKNDQQIFAHKFKILSKQNQIDNKELITALLLIEYYNYILYFQ